MIGLMIRNRIYWMLLFIFQNNNQVPSCINLFRLMVLIYSILLHLINAAKEICIGTPYFIPGKNYECLIKSKRRGVQITILVPEKLIALSFGKQNSRTAEKLIQAGCNIYAFQQGFSRQNYYSGR